MSLFLSLSLLLSVCDLNAMEAENRCRRLFSFYFQFLFSFLLSSFLFHFVFLVWGGVGDGGGGGCLFYFLFFSFFLDDFCILEGSCYGLLANNCGKISVKHMVVRHVCHTPVTEAHVLAGALAYVSVHVLAHVHVPAYVLFKFLPCLQYHLHYLLFLLLLYHYMGPDVYVKVDVSCKIFWRLLDMLLLLLSFSIAC